MGLTLITAPVLEPVSLAEAKAHLRFEEDGEDELIAALITAARERAELVSRRVCLTSTWRLALDEFPPWELALPRAPVQAVTSIDYVDPAGALATVDPADYVLAADEPPRVTPAIGRAWPATACAPEAARVTFIAGWTSPERVPAKLRLAILALVAHWFEHREGQELPAAAELLLASHRW